MRLNFSRCHTSSISVRRRGRCGCGHVFAAGWAEFAQVGFVLGVDRGGFAGGCGAGGAARGFGGSDFVDVVRAGGVG